MCDTADVVVENFRAGTLGFFGLDYDDAVEAQSAADLCIDHRLRPGRPLAQPHGIRADGAGRGWITANEHSVRHYGEDADGAAHGQPVACRRLRRTSGGDRHLAALHSRKTTGQGQYIDVAMAATLLAVNERAHVDLSDEDIGAEPAVLGATHCSFFTGPQGEHFTVATSIVGSRTFPSWLRAMRRVDLMEDPRFSSAAGRRLNFGALHQSSNPGCLTFPDMATLDAQFDEAKIAMGEIRSIKELTRSEWSDYWGAVQLVPDRSGGEYKLPGRPWHFLG